jgi:RNA polymerase sigma-70 factor (ECF subfamily)
MKERRVQATKPVMPTMITRPALPPFSPPVDGAIRDTPLRKGRDVSEDNLLCRARDGDAEAFDHLFLLCKDEVYASLYHLLDGDSDAIEEAVGNVFLGAFRGLPRFRGEAAFTTYLYRITVNEAHAQRKRRTRRERTETPFGSSEASLRDMNQPDPAVLYQRNEEERRLTRAVQALPEPYRTPVILRYLSGVAAVEIAQILKRPAGTIRYQVSRGLQILRERLERDDNL